MTRKFKYAHKSDEELERTYQEGKERKRLHEQQREIKLYGRVIPEEEKQANKKRKEAERKIRDAEVKEWLEKNGGKMTYSPEKMGSPKKRKHRGRVPNSRGWN